MGTRAIRKAIAVAAIFFLALACAVPEVFAWGSATHAYIDDHLGISKKQPLRNMNEIYGGMAPDVFNYMFDHFVDWYPYLYTQTHYANFPAIWEKACSKLGQSEAYGFVSHNGMWGADLTAHGIGSPGESGYVEGYVVAKAWALVPYLEAALAGYGIDLHDPEKKIALEFCHNIVEAAVDILVAQQLDRTIGTKMASAAVLRSPEFPLLLARVYAKDFASAFPDVSYLEALKIITAEETKFRKTVVLYGHALAQDEDTAIELVSGQMADMAAKLLDGLGISLDPAAVALLPDLANTFIRLAKDNFVSLDFENEIAVTIEYVEQNLVANGISY